MLQPLAFRVRPDKIEDVIGQKDILGENGILTNSIKEKLPISFILYGVPGCGKTTIAEAYAKSLGIHFAKINAVTSNKSEIENAIAQTKLFGPMVLIIDEVHRLNKDKQDILLPYIEDGTIYLIGATTANPYIAINKAIRSRCQILEVKRLSEDELIEGMEKAINNPKGLNNKFTIDKESLSYIARSSNGDFRFALNYLEILDLTYKNQKITLEMTKSVLKVPNYSGDKDEDDHYNAVSALQKSIRGSDVDASLYYLAKLCTVNDLESVARRLLVTAYEDVGLANPAACMRCKIAIDAALQVGLPEAIIPLSDTVIELALSPKSKAGDLAVNRAMDQINSQPLEVMDYLKLTPVNVAEEDLYPYDRPDVWPKLQYLPEPIKNMKFYIPEDNSQFEKVMNDSYRSLSRIKRSSNLRELKKKKD
jgi:ATPase related to the helicase subunit of the Holliday junction resolvase